MKYLCRNKKLSYQEDLIIKVFEYVSDLLEITNKTTVKTTVTVKKLKAKVGGELLFGNNDKFIIQLNSENSLVYSLSKLCHEMVHLKQVQDGRLTFVSQNTVQWLDDEGNTLDYQVIQSASSKQVYDDYRDQPWEVEAHELERVLFAKVKKEFKDYQIAISSDLTVPVF